MKPITLTATINLKANANGKPRRFSILAYSGGLLPVEGFEYPVICDLSGLESPTAIPILIDHTKSVEATLGLTDTITNNGKTLTLGGPVTGVSATARQVIAQSEAGHTWQASIGASVIECEDIAAGQSISVNGQQFTGPVIVARRSVLRETSVLPMGADSSTSVNLAARAAANLKGASMPTVEEWLTSLGIDPTSLSPEDMAAFQLAYESKQAPPVAAAPAVVPPVAAPVVAPTASAGASKLDILAKAQVDIQAANKLYAENQERISAITAKAVGYPDIAATAVRLGWTADKVELEVLKRSNVQARAGVTSFQSAQNQPENLPLVLEAGLCMARRIKGTETQYEDKVLQAAHGRFRSSGMGLKQLFIMAAAANGMPLEAGMSINTGNMRRVLSYACPDARSREINAGFSTLSLPGILSNVANKDILQGYMEEEQSWREVAKVKSVSDLKTATSYRMLDDMEYEQLGPTGNIKHGTTSEESYTRKAKTYAKMYVLPREAIINDDLGAFDDMRDRIGRGSAKKFNRVFWTRWLDNSTLFTSGRGNYITGATTTLLTDMVGLQLALDAFDALRTPTADGSKVVGGLMGGSPTVLLTPGGAIFSKAEQIYKNSNLGSGTANADANIFSGRYKPVKSVFLNDSTITNYSATGWYLLRDPGAGSAVVVSFLDGVETPTVESADADFDQLGIQFRGFHDFGVDQAEYLAGVKSKGAA